MENKKSEMVHIGSSEDMPSIFEKLNRSGAKDIVLAVPEKAILMQNVSNLKMLKKIAEELKKNISIVMTGNDNESKTFSRHGEKTDGDTINKMNAIIERNAVVSSRPTPDSRIISGVSESALQMEVSRSCESKNKVKMFDIVRKIENSDIEAEKLDENKASFESARNEWPENIFKRTSSKEDANKPHLMKNLADIRNDRKKISFLPSISAKFFTVFIFFCLATAVVAMAFVLPKADVDITLKTEAMNYDFDAIAEESISEVDALQNKIPAKKVEVESEESEGYPTTGKKHITSKASGKITVYNEYSSSPQRIVANTRFLSKDGYIFRIAEAITIPGFSRVEGKDVPGEMVVTVFADKAGEKYNIGAASFTLPALQGTAKYSTIYARSSQAMSGGADREVSYFSEGDYITAKDKLTKTLIAKNEQSLSGKISNQDKLLDNTKQENNVKISTDVKTGDPSDNFKMTVYMKTSALFVTNADIDNLTTQKINSQITQNREFITGSKKYEVKNVRKGSDGKTIISISVKENSVAKINAKKIKEEILGKNEDELKRYFNNVSDIKSVNVNFWPFWVKNVPLSADKTNVTIDTNNSI